MKRTSVWVDTGRRATSARSSTATSTPTSCVIGGGIVGITTALLLQEAGVRTVLLEANRLACGVSGFTTAKVSSQHGLDLRAPALALRARRRRGLRRRQPGGARVDGRARRARRHRVRLAPPALLRLPDRATAAKAEQEAEAAAEAGLPASLVEETGLPYPSRPPCASRTRPSSTSASTCSRSAPG